MSFITIVRVPTVSLNDLHTQGSIFTDPLCTAQRAGILKGDCTDPAIQQAGDWNMMLSHMHHPTETQVRAWFGPKWYVKGEANLYYVADSDFVAAPDYRPLTDPSHIVGVFVPQGVHVLGGQIGFMNLLPIGDQMDTLVSVDGICFMYGAPNETGRPQTFAPASELQRVKRCAR